MVTLALFQASGTWLLSTDNGKTLWRIVASWVAYVFRNHGGMPFGSCDLNGFNLFNSFDRRLHWLAVTTAMVLRAVERT